MKRSITLLLWLFIGISGLASLTALANPISCPEFPTPEDTYWRPEGQPAGNFIAAAYYLGTHSVYCYYQNPTGIITGFLRSKFTVKEIDGADWVRIVPCPMEKSCYTCKKSSETSCHFRS